jgi:hypothetical protein
LLPKIPEKNYGILRKRNLRKYGAGYQRRANEKGAILV